MAILTAIDGQLFFGGIHGLHSIRPDQVKERAEEQAVIFTDFRIFNERIPVGPLADGRTILQAPIEGVDQIELSYEDNSFSISFSAIDYTNPLTNQFSYQMEGFDQQWQYTSRGQHSATYTNLDPGNYTFRVRHLDTEASIEIQIAPPFWQTIWFRALASLLIIGLILFSGFFILQRREAAHKQQMLEARSEILQLRNEKLAADVDAKNAKLMFSAVQMTHKNDLLNKVKTEVASLPVPSSQELQQLLRTLDHELKNEDYWKEFDLYFNQVERDLGNTLLAHHPELTSNDLRMFALIRLNLTTKEIASLLNISVRGVEQSRYRLKKRLGLSGEDNLNKFITGFSGHHLST